MTMIENSNSFSVESFASVSYHVPQIEKTPLGEQSEVENSNSLVHAEAVPQSAVSEEDPSPLLPTFSLLNHSIEESLNQESLNQDSLNQDSLNVNKVLYTEELPQNAQQIESDLKLEALSVPEEEISEIENLEKSSDKLVHQSNQQELIESSQVALDVDIDSNYQESFFISQDESTDEDRGLSDAEEKQVVHSSLGASLESLDEVSVEAKSSEEVEASAELIADVKTSELLRVPNVVANPADVQSQQQTQLQISLPAALCDDLLILEIASIPSKMGFKIGEVADMLGIKQYILRYWESEFDVLKPKKASNKQRYYTRKDVENAYLIRKLLHRDRFSIEGAKSAMKELKTFVKTEVKKEKAFSTLSLTLQSLEEMANDLLNQIRRVKNIFK